MTHINYTRRAVVPMISNATGKAEFDVIIYGYTLDQLTVVPAPAPITNLARKYPNHKSSPFFLWEFADVKTTQSTARRHIHF